MLHSPFTSSGFPTKTTFGIMALTAQKPLHIVVFQDSVMKLRRVAKQRKQSTARSVITAATLFPSHFSSCDTALALSCSCVCSVFNSFFLGDVTPRYGSCAKSSEDSIKFRCLGHVRGFPLVWGTSRRRSPTRVGGSVFSRCCLDHLA